jgi:hypothetical protein
MDLNDLYYRHGAALLKAWSATSSHARIHHLTAASAYARQIAESCPTPYRKTYEPRTHHVQALLLDPACNCARPTLALLET